MPGLRDLAPALAVVGGLLLVVSGVSGSLGLWGFLLALLTELLPQPYNLLAYYTMLALSTLASLGGATVMLGAYLMYKGSLRLGKLLVSIGSGTGVLGFLTFLISRALQGPGSLLEFAMTLTSSTGWLGITLCVIAMVLARGRPGARVEEAEEAEVVPSVRRLTGI